MINRKKTINRIALTVLLVTLSLMTFAFLLGNNTVPSNDESIETFYGRAIFGGKFAWMDNVKRPGITNSSVELTEPLSFDFNLSSATVVANLNPVQDSALIASIIDPVRSSSFKGPFDGEAGLNDLIHIEQVMSPSAFDVDNGGSSSSGFSNISNDNNPVDDKIIIPSNDPEDDDKYTEPTDPVIVPTPGSISLALIGVASIIQIRKKK